MVIYTEEQYRNVVCVEGISNILHYYKCVRYVEGIDKVV